MVPTSGSRWASYEELRASHPMRDSELFSRAPWFHPQGLLDTALVMSYVDAGGWLPGGFRLETIQSWDWKTHIAVHSSCLRRDRQNGESLHDARSAMARLAFQRMSRTLSDVPIPPALQLDLGLYRTDGEISYAERLSQLDVSRWRGFFGPDTGALCWTRPIILAEFRYIRKGSRGNFKESIRFERRCRRRFGYMVPYQSVEAQRFHPRHLQGRYVRIPNCWGSLEMPGGCYVELPPCVSYVGSQLISDKDSGFWAVFASEWCAKVAAHIL